MILFDLISKQATYLQDEFCGRALIYSSALPAEELLEWGVSISLLGDEGRGGDRREKNFPFFLFFLLVKNMKGRQIAWKMLVRTVWSKHLLGWLLTCHKQRALERTVVPFAPFIPLQSSECRIAGNLLVFQTVLLLTVENPV